MFGTKQFGQTNTNAPTPFSGFGSTPTPTSIFVQQSQPAFGSSPSFGPSPFGGSSTTASSSTENQTFGNTTSGFGLSPFRFTNVTASSAASALAFDGSTTDFKLGSSSGFGQPMHTLFGTMSSVGALNAVSDGPSAAGQSTAAFGFGQSSPTTWFGQTTSSSSFLSSTYSNPFAPAVSNSLFGSSSTSTFGSSPFGTSNLVGTTSSLYGSTTQILAYGSSPSIVITSAQEISFSSGIRSNLFGSTSSSIPSLFGSTTQTSSPASMFDTLPLGSTSVFGPGSGNTEVLSIFQSSAAPALTSTCFPCGTSDALNLFGSTSSSAPSLFGSTTHISAFVSSPSIFGTSTFTFGTNLGFGNTKSTSIFQSSDAPALTSTSSPFGHNAKSSFGEYGFRFGQSNLFCTEPPSTFGGSLFSSSSLSLLSNKNPIGVGQTAPSPATLFQSGQPAHSCCGFTFTPFCQSQKAPASGASGFFGQSALGQSDVKTLEGHRTGKATVAYEQEADIEALMPKLPHSDYYTEPSIQEMAAKERAEQGYCRHVKDFVVGRHGYGSIRFFGETDVRRLNLESIVQFNNREVIVYLDDRQRPPVGEGLNKPAEVTLLNIKCVNKTSGEKCIEGATVEKFKQMLRRKAEGQSAEFVSYDPVKGEWRFRVQHFSIYELGEEDDFD